MHAAQRLGMLQQLSDCLAGVHAAAHVLQGQKLEALLGGGWRGEEGEEEGGEDAERGWRSKGGVEGSRKWHGLRAESVQQPRDIEDSQHASEDCWWCEGGVVREPMHVSTWRFPILAACVPASMR